jgi:hypothetical protein
MIIGDDKVTLSFCKACWFGGAGRGALILSEIREPLNHEKPNILSRHKGQEPSGSSVLQPITLYPGIGKSYDDFNIELIIRIYFAKSTKKMISILIPERQFKHVIDTQEAQTVVLGSSVCASSERNFRITNRD